MAKKVVFKDPQDNYNVTFKEEQDNTLATFEKRQKNIKTTFKAEQNNQKAIFERKQNNYEAEFEELQDNERATFKKDICIKDIKLPNADKRVQKVLKEFSKNHKSKDATIENLIKWLFSCALRKIRMKD